MPRANRVVDDLAAQTLVRVTEAGRVALPKHLPDREPAGIPCDLRRCIPASLLQKQQKTSKGFPMKDSQGGEKEGGVGGWVGVLYEEVYPPPPSYKTTKNIRRVSSEE